MQTARSRKGMYGLEYLKDNGIAVIENLTRKESYSLALSVSSQYNGLAVTRYGRNGSNMVIVATPPAKGKAVKGTRVG